ncbi:MAG TPA: glycoside hydrolase family 38 C-terminal domain-containing protein [Gemmatimonadales bacterium]|nr:glycoside hydrolase family 38 C-terminal domain-containing protein [Gemmatimonadales bacterium]
MKPWLTRAVRLACAAALIGATARAQDLSITRWLLRGPIHTDTGATRVTRDYLGGETTVLPDSGDVVAGGGWVPVDADSLGGIDLLRVFHDSTDNAAAYAHAYVYAPADRTILLVMDSDDDLVAWLNGQRVWLNVVARGLRSGSDTVPVRLGAGWNSLLLKAVNRSGGFGVLGRLAREPGEPPLDGIRTAYRRPAGVAGHVFPAGTITGSALRLAGAATWNRDRIELPATLALTAWGRDTLAGVLARVTQAGSSWTTDSVTSLVPAESRVLHFHATFDELRRAALDVAPLKVAVTWPGGSHDANLAVDADWLLRVWGGCLAVGSWLRDSAPDGARHLQTTLIVPSALAGRTVDLLAAQFGQRATYQVNRHPVAWRDGAVELCAPCRDGDTLSVAVELEPGRPWWTFPDLHVREIGYKEFADGYAYARRLAGRVPPIDQPDPREWLGAIGGGTAYSRLLDRYTAAYASLAAELKRDTLHLIGNSHIDAAWLWPWSETEHEVIPNTWRTSLKLASMFPGYVFAASAAAYYDAVDHLYPGLADSLRAAVQAGQWDLVGGWWLEPDQNIPSGEDLARQGLYGQRYFQRHYGRRAKVGWTPDSFGYPWTLPQIYKLAGLDYFVTQKIRWNDSTQLPYDAFWWEGRDGTRLFTYNPFGYDHDLEPQRLISDRLDDQRRNNGIHHQIVLYGVGDHGGGPTIEMLQRAEGLRRVPTFPTMVYDNAGHALADVRASEPDSAFPVWHDELYLEYHRATYTTQARQKWSARHSDALLRTAEALAAVDTAAYPHARLDRAWHRILFNEFHDILPGSGIHQVYLDANASYDSAWATLDTVTERAFGDLRARLDTRAAGRTIPVVVFNALTWPRTGLVRVRLPKGDTAIVLARDVPSLGARVFAVRPDAALASQLPAPTVGPTWLENAYLRVEVDTTTGEITRLYDRRQHREALARGGRANVLQVLYDLPQEWDAWNTGFNGQQWTVTETSGLVRHADGAEAGIRFTRRWGRSTFAQTLTLGRETPFLDVANDVDWRETHKMLKVALAAGVSPDSATYEIPYGTIGRSCNPQTKAERAKYEVPGQRWADLSDSSYGLSVLNDSKYGWDCRGNVLRLSLLRSPLWPDSLADRGRNQFRFALYPHAGDWRAAGTERLAADYNTPLVASAETPHGGALGRAVSFASVDAPGVELTWVKRAEDSDAWILRLVEWSGRPATATVTLRPEIRSAHKSNFLEDPGETVPATAHTLRVALRPYEIATVVVEVR